MRNYDEPKSIWFHIMAWQAIAVNRRKRGAPEWHVQSAWRRAETHINRARKGEQS